MFEQQNNNSLDKIKKLVDEGVSSDKVGFFMHKGILYREFKSEIVEAGKRLGQVVVPKKMRERVLKLALGSLTSRM